jgi:hypothetical protein
MHALQEAGPGELLEVAPHGVARDVEPGGELRGDHPPLAAEDVKDAALALLLQHAGSAAKPG